ncbi:thioredoxin [Myxococcus xanthus]|uniref:Thioredoxin n=1 Tax=Myxococcus xanthus TaxID=34 RepID=A0AAE6G681_MYXXA|nr:thioredoxin [Myxococcus xanthus]QDE71324.1 thioredoxin [Myxococcus xanthus]QDE78604.1 thioredoxin [Myxococcus xanthus]QDE85974.1 thioredoxin [Myxococcus xanthus]QDF07914.1 thioredoxin [Myxococcus xanthus]
MTTNVIPLDDAHFQREVLESSEPVLVDFTATWCPPCRALAPVLDAIAADFRGRLKVTSLDVDDNPESAMRYGVRSVPALLLFKEGKVVRQLLGAQPRAKLEQELRTHLG